MSAFPWQIEPESSGGESLPYAVIDPTDSYQFRASVQSFGAGGYEAVVKLLNRRRIEECPPLPKRGLRLRPENPDPENVERSRRRAKTTVRWLCKHIAADHMSTLTTRESKNTPRSLMKKWQKAVAAYRRVTGEDFPYVAVPEPHPSNPEHYHLHIAHYGFLKLKLMRQIWWTVCGGRGLGNVDVRYFRTKHGHSKSHKIACYISKYIMKLPVEFFNKKRYWASRTDLPEKRSWWMRGVTLEDARIELALQLGLDPASLQAGGESFEFPEGSGFWYAYIPELHAADPPPF